MTDMSPPLQFTRSRRTRHRAFHLIAGITAFALCLVLTRFLYSAALWPKLTVGCAYVLTMVLAAAGLVFMKTFWSDFEETWTFSAAGVHVSSRTPFGRTDRTWPLQKATLRVQPEGTPPGYNLLLRIGKGEWMLVFRFDDKHLAARTMTRIELLITAAA